MWPPVYCETPNPSTLNLVASDKVYFNEDADLVLSNDQSLLNCLSENFTFPGEAVSTHLSDFLRFEDKT